ITSDKQKEQRQFQENVSKILLDNKGKLSPKLADSHPFKKEFSDVNALCEHLLNANDDEFADFFDKQFLSALYPATKKGILKESIYDKSLEELTEMDKETIKQADGQYKIPLVNGGFLLIIRAHQTTNKQRFDQYVFCDANGKVSRSVYIGTTNQITYDSSKKEASLFKKIENAMIPKEERLKPSVESEIPLERFSSKAFLAKILAGQELSDYRGQEQYSFDSESKLAIGPVRVEINKRNKTVLVTRRKQDKLGELIMKFDFEDLPASIKVRLDARRSRALTA
ncbi:MAG: hypothetical protein LW817_05945, partial [Candidatus Caenarcaniphilales bacterium]|nr:hypothetical protein [Candidatus Caenarcaniphilales bacterium]